MKINYSLPIIKTKKSEVLKVIKNNLNEYSFFEVWLDYIEDLDNKFVGELTQLLGGRLIILLRRQNLDPIKIELSKRLDIISALNGSPVHLDLDVLNQKEELEYIKKNNLNIPMIVSHHNYQETPSEAILSEIVNDIKSHKPAILKISTLCKNAKDVLTLLNMLENLNKKNVRSIISGMGEFGIITKVWGTLMGNEMIFAPINIEEKSAPGQLTKKQLETIFKELSF